MPLERRRLVATPDLGGTAPTATPPAGYAFTPYFRQGVWYYKDDTDTEFELIPVRNPYFVQDTTGNVPIVAAPATVVFNNERVANANYVLAAGVITITEPGLYDIDYTVGIDVTNNTGGQRGTVLTFLELDNTLIPGSAIQIYIREASGGFTGSKRMFVQITAGQALRMRVDRTVGNTVIDTSDESTISIIRVGA